MKQFPQEILGPIKKALQEERRQGGQPIAAFDADGTLWAHDMGEGFFKYQIAKKLLEKSLANYLDPWKYYRQWKDGGDERPALLWLAQINAGQTLTKVQEWAEAFVQSQEPLPIFAEQRNLVQFLQDEGVKIFVVTASIKWSVEPAAARLNIPKEQVLGMQTLVREGLVTTEPLGALTFREGKADGLLQATGGKPAFFASGNSTGDTFLLKSATQIRLAVRSHHKNHELFTTEESLNEIARQEGWLHYSFN